MLQIKPSNHQYMLDNGGLKMNHWVPRLAVQWEPGLMIPFATYKVIRKRFQVKYVIINN